MYLTQACMPIKREQEPPKKVQTFDKKNTEDLLVLYSRSKIFSVFETLCMWKLHVTQLFIPVSLYEQLVGLVLTIQKTEAKPVRDRTQNFVNGRIFGATSTLMGWINRLRRRRPL